MSNRLWAEHVKPKSFWKRLPLIVKVLLIGSLLIGGAYAAVQVLFTQTGLIHVIGTGLSVTIVTPAGFNNLNVTNPLTQYEEIRQNVTWTVQNTGQVRMSIRYFTSLPGNLTMYMFLVGGQDLQGQTLTPGSMASGYFNITVGHLTATSYSFALTVQGCYPVGMC